MANFLMFDGKKYENMLSHDYRKCLINGGNIKLRHLKEDKIFLKFYNTNLHGVKPIDGIRPVTTLTSSDLQRSNQLNEMAPEKLSVEGGEEPRI